MKKLLIYCLLLTMINSTFFVGENHNNNSNQEEYNSVIEFVMEGCLDIPDETPEDEDDDIPDTFKPQMDNYSIVIFECKHLFYSKGSPLTSFDIFTAYSCFLDKNSPPPKLA